MEQARAFSTVPLVAVAWKARESKGKKEKGTQSFGRFFFCMAGDRVGRIFSFFCPSTASEHERVLLAGIVEKGCRERMHVRDAGLTCACDRTDPFDRRHEKEKTRLLSC